MSAKTLYERKKGKMQHTSDYNKVNTGTYIYLYMAVLGVKVVKFFNTFLNYWDLLFGLYPSPICWVRSIDWTQQSRFHLRTREEPSLETLWLQNTGAMDKSK
jgi:hypothetical protein